MPPKFILRRFYGTPFMEPSNLIEGQTASFKTFLQADIEPDKRQNVGLQYLFKTFSPIKSPDGRGSIEFVSYSVAKPVNSPDKCRQKHLTYESEIKATFRLVIYNNGTVGEIKEETITLFHLPLMDYSGTFIVNGIDKTLLSQIVRAPGATILKNKKESTYKVTVIPDYGAWIQFEFDKRGLMVCRIDNSYAIPATIFFYAFGCSDDEIGRLAPDMSVSANKDIEQPTLDAIDEYLGKNQEEAASVQTIAARLEIFKKLRKNDIPTISSANKLFKNHFFTRGRYDLSKTGRIKLNKKTGLDIPADSMLLEKEEVLVLSQMLVRVKKNDGEGDNIDSIENKVVKQFCWQMTDHLRDAFVPMVKEAVTILRQSHLPNIMPHNVFPVRYLYATISKFFNLNPLCQFSQQTNALADLIQKRKLNAAGRGGLDRNSASLEARDIQPSQYGRICPIDTPEGKNIGIVSTLSSYARVNDLGILETPYYRVKNGLVTDRLKYLEPGDELKHVIADFNSIRGGKIREGYVSARIEGEVKMTETSQIDLVDCSPCQLVSVATAMVPFLEHNDGHRALMATNMQKQAVPLLRPEAPLVGTGMEKVVAMESPYVVKAKYDGVVEQADAMRILVRRSGTIGTVDSYRLKKFKGTNQGTWFHQKTAVKKGDVVKKGDLLADGPAMQNGELALGKNLLVAYMSWSGYGYEDSIILSERVLKENLLDSIHIKKLDINELKTKIGNELFTKNVPDVSHEVLRHLDERGIVKIGSYVRPGDYLVGKVVPKGEDSLSGEQALLRAVFGNTAKEVKDDSLEVPPGVEGVVVDVQILSKTLEGKEETEHFDKEKQTLLQAKRDEIEIARTKYSVNIQKIISKFPGILVGLDEKPIKDTIGISATALYEVTISPSYDTSEEVKESLNGLVAAYCEQVDLIDTVYRNRKAEHIAADKLPDNVRRRVTVTIAMRRRIQPGDKLAGRYGNKGVVSRILPVEDMPYLEDGTPVDVILNPLGVPSRMNIGQLLETQVAMALSILGKKAQEMAQNGASEAELRAYLKELYSDPEIHEVIDQMGMENLKKTAQSLENGLPIASPVFVGASEEDINELCRKADLPLDGRFMLYDGRTGEPFDSKVLVGKKFIMKLYHLVEDKMHARSTGPYSAITQQPLKGRAKHGGQRIGEMEVWAMYSYGAAYNLLEMMSVKSDDMDGRHELFEEIVKNGHYRLRPARIEAFNVLKNELRALCLDVEEMKPEETIRHVRDEMSRRSEIMERNIVANKAARQLPVKKQKVRTPKETDIEKLEEGEET